MMSGVLSGAAFGPQVNNLYKDGDPPANVGHCFILLDVSCWMLLEEYYAGVERFLREVKASPHAKGVEEILYPGERRYRTYLEKMESRASGRPPLSGGSCGPRSAVPADRVRPLVTFPRRVPSM